MIFQRGSRRVRGSWAFKAGDSVSCARSKSLTHTTPGKLYSLLMVFEVPSTGDYHCHIDLGCRPAKALDSCSIPLFNPITTVLATVLASNQKPWGWRQTSSRHSGRMP